MPATTTGDFIRVINYVDDVATTLRRINANLPFMTDEEKKKLAEYMRKVEPNYLVLVEKLEKGGA